MARGVDMRVGWAAKPLSIREERVKKTERSARDLGSSADSARDWVAPRVEAAVYWAEKGIETASPKIQEGLSRAAQELAEGVYRVTPRIQESLERVAPRISAVVDEATPRIQGAAEKAAPALQHARDVVVREYLPAASVKLGEAADYTIRKLDEVSAAPVVQKAAAAVKMDKKALKKAAAGHSAKAPKGQARGGGKKGLLVFAVFAAAAAAGIAAWKASKPVEDPWKSPAPVDPAPIPVVAGAPESAEPAAGPAVPAPGSAMADTEPETAPIGETLPAGEVEETPVGEAGAGSEPEAPEEGSSEVPKPGPRGGARRRTPDGAAE
ncbi:hypothetical protein NCCP1664_14600 [Zafaria cholistanensis]|uniref:Uncharacterized protein n=1 Tax=Zafaria cholistanensis TaxID=1682741 RepID=A0A5A7NPV6_9MICC|nr:hypothetical protein NCCP1664_14600 [Zafaria cholistanensis]